MGLGLDWDDREWGHHFARFYGIYLDVCVVLVEPLIDITGISASAIPEMKVKCNMLNSILEMLQPIKVG